MVLSFAIYYALLILIDLLSITIWHSLSRPEKFLAVLIWITSLDEGLVFLLQQQHKLTAIIYHIYSPIELFFLSLYFQESVPALKRLRISIGIAVIAIGWAVINAQFFQPLNTVNTNFLLLESAMVIIFCLAALRQILLEDVRPAYKFRLFWLACLLLIYWSVTFTGWGLFTLLAHQQSVVHQLFFQVLSSINLVLYTGIVLVFINHKKLIPSGG